jgi:peptidoglycan/LPS O-acetylase OafA/YrhL
MSLIPRQERLDYLDSIRGIAALIVVCCHCWQLHAVAFIDRHRYFADVTGSPLDTFYYILERISQGGRAAVIIFFVLSGFVLSLSLQKNPLPYGNYLTRRMFRIYPTFAITIIASFALHRMIGTVNYDGLEWHLSNNQPDTSYTVLLKHFLFWGTKPARMLDGVMWTLVHEIRISLIFPFILLLLIRYKWRALIMLQTLSITCTLGILYITGIVIKGYEEDTFLLSLFDTGYFIIFFAAGAYLAIERQWVAEKISSLPKWCVLLLIPIIIVLLLKSDTNTSKAIGCISDYMRGLGAILLIALPLGIKKFSSALHHQIPIWLGRVSYSLYLVHVPIVYALTQTIAQSWSILEVSLATIILSLISAELLARFVEFPFIELGKKLCTRFDNRLQQTNAA